MSFKNDEGENQLKTGEEEFVFSIIMAIYNTGDYLKEAIESLISQSFPFTDVQLILVDDGSTDNCPEICQEYAERYPNIIYIHQENQGQSIARNAGLKEVRGKYVNFLDSDDKLEPNALEDVYEFFKNHCEEIDVVSISRYLFGSVNGPMEFQDRYDNTRIVDIEEEYDFPQTSVSASFIKRDAFNFEFDERIIISEDSHVLNRIILDKCKFGIVGSAKYLYRKRDTQNSTVDSKKTKKEYFSQRMEHYFKDLIAYTIEKRGCVIRYIQSLLLYDLKWLFFQSSEDDVLNSEEKQTFYNDIHEVLQYIDDEMILEQNFNDYLKQFIINFKHNNDLFNEPSLNRIKKLDISQRNNKINMSATYVCYGGDFNLEVFNNDEKVDVEFRKTNEQTALGQAVSASYDMDISFEVKGKSSRICFKVNDEVLPINPDKSNLGDFDNIEVDTEYITVHYSDKDLIRQKYEALELLDKIEELEKDNENIKNRNKFLLKKYKHYQSSKAYRFWRKYGRFEEVKTKEIKNLKDIKVALIADQFTYDSYKYEFTVVDINPDDWKQQFEMEKPDLFFCESAWDGYNFEGDYGPWHEKIFKDYRVDYENRKDLLDILEYCKSNNIPTVFWNKEDPTSYKNSIRSFADTASKFDYIFTSAKECVRQYETDFNHPNVSSLMFAAQPKLFNPLNLKKEHRKGIAFAGSYYSDFPQRAKMMDDIFNRLIEKDAELLIYDRNYYLDCRDYPKEYDEYINPPIDYDETPDLYRACDWCLNFNTITKSETMFARRIFELALSYTNILTNYSVGVDEIFKDNVFVFDRTDELPDFERGYDEKRLNNLYNVLENHTYRKRWIQILDTIGFDYADDLKDVTVIYDAADGKSIDEIIDNFNNIDYPQKTLKLLSKSDLKEKYPQVEVYSDISKLRDSIDTEYWILADEAIDSDFIKNAVLHYQYLNKRVSISNKGELFTITEENIIENKLFSKINIKYLTDADEFEVYSI